MSIIAIKLNVTIMLKIIAPTVLLLTATVSCSKIDETSSTTIYDCNSINFESQSTKAISNDINKMMSAANGFVVYGAEVNGSDWYENLDGNRYIYDSSSYKWMWDSVETPSWADPFSPIIFYAYYPESASGFTLTDSAPSSIMGDVIVEKSILNQTDYLASCSGVITSKPITGIQPLSFSHIMSKISFSILQDEGILTVIRQLGIENIINVGRYDYVNSQWLDLSNNNIASFDDYVCSSGPFAKKGVANKIDPIRIDGHYLMLIPQTAGDDDNQTPLWDGTIKFDESGNLALNGAYISMRYRTDLNSEDIIGYAIRESSPNDTEWSTYNYFYDVYKKSGGSYNGPLYIKVGFKFSSTQLDWVAGTEYDYNLQLNKGGGIYLSEYYYDVDGQNTKIRVKGSPSVGDPVFSSDINVDVTIKDWLYSESNIYPI